MGGGASGVSGAALGAANTQQAAAPSGPLTFHSPNWFPYVVRGEACTITTTQGVTLRSTAASVPATNLYWRDDGS